ncbi:hypothetical protein DXG03_002310 [Asterophora parasitica]|uniref:Uncharacterized protein n=1 Tax=Asterophora parasitica TaxID=117018 RepID=A0A9P7G267_9AGAR|nr:hypothetical protein DXG03_002310 [Asterophora parasitica]
MNDNFSDTRAPQEEKLEIFSAFFASRKESHLRTEAEETDKDRQARLDRERNPPTALTKVFTWEELFDEMGTYKRIAISRWQRTQALDLYRPDQKRYNPYCNEWDCCDELGDIPDSEEASAYSPSTRVDDITETDNSSGSLTPRHLNGRASEACTPVAFQPPPAPDSVRNSLAFMADIWQQEIFEILDRSYGCTPPLPITLYIAPQFSEIELKNTLRAFGKTWEHSFLYAHLKPAARLTLFAYFRSLVHEKEGPPSACDLHRANRHI